MSKLILELLKDYYQGWEEQKRELLKLHPGLIHKSIKGTFLSADEFINDCWRFSGIPLNNKQFIVEGNIAIVRYEIDMPDGTSKNYCEWVTFENGLIKTIDVFNN